MMFLPDLRIISTVSSVLWLSVRLMRRTPFPLDVLTVGFITMREYGSSRAENCESDIYPMIL